MGKGRRTRSRSATSLAILAILSLIATAFPAGPAAAETITVEWTRQFGSAGAEFVRAVATDAAGNVYVLGDTDGTLPGQASSGGVDAWLRKFDADGNVLWTRQFGTAGFDRGGFNSGGLAVGSDAVYVGGLTTGAFPGYTNAGLVDAFLRRYDLNGNVVWTRQFGTAGDDDIHDVAVDRDKSVYVAGSVIGQLPGQPWGGGSDAYVRSYTPDGDVVWTRQFGTAGFEHFNAVTFDATGVYAAGHTDSAVAGGPNAGGIDVFLQRYDRDGILEWTRQFGTASLDLPNSIAADAGAVYLVGITEGTLAPGGSGGRDVFVAAYNPGGHEKWTRQFGTPGLDQGFGVSVVGRAVFVSGAVSGALPGQTYSGGVRDAFVRRYEGQSGEEVWTHQFGTPAQDAAFAVRATETRTIVYVGGFTTGTFPGATYAGGGNDVYLRKIALSD